MTYPEAEVEGFKIGMFVSYDALGDAWVKAPDGSTGTLIWETGEPESFEPVIEPEVGGRWGTYAVRQPLPLTTDLEAAEYLRAVLPRLRTCWEDWKTLQE
jgi:hypothetical protein